MDEGVIACKEIDEDLKTVEVRGFKLDISNDALQLYFENPRKGGGDILQFQRHNAVLYITFADCKGK